MKKYPHAVENLFGRPWAIVPEYFETMRGILMRRLDGEGHVDFDALTAARVIDDDAPVWMLEGGQLVDGVAVIPVTGAMSRHMNFFMQFSGGVSTDLLWGAISSALADDTVEAIVLDIDSPGGAVNGSFSVAGNLFQARGVKPVVAIANGLAASAAYLLGSAADILMVNEAGEVGSIGVILTHVDFTEANKMDGVKPTHIYRGEFKAMGSGDVALDRASTAYLQSIVDEAYTLFVNRVARNRGLTQQAVMDTEARTFMGDAAVEAGLADTVGELGDAIKAARDMVGIAAPRILDTRKVFIA